MFDTIVALATPPFKSALAIIRISGDDAFKIASSLFSKDLTKETSKGVHFGHVALEGKLIDEVILLQFIKPASFTGEDTIEIICHGSMLIANQIIEACISKGARIATRGEFSQRAFYNGKMDLIQAESINDIINATSLEAKQLSLLSLSGQASSLIAPLKEKIADLLALIEVNIDYPEYEDIEQVNRKKILHDTKVIQTLISSLIDQGRQGRIIKEGLTLAIVGKPNVGKSSLLNALLKEEKAIVTPIPGTTRDVVEGDIILGGLTLRLLDTAGLHESKDIVEKIGIEKTKNAIEKVDLVIVVLDASENLTKDDEDILELTKDKNRLIVYNKADLKKDKTQGKLYVSALLKDIGALEKAIVNLFGIEPLSYLRPSLNNSRQIGLLENIFQSISQARIDTQNDAPLDVISISLTEAFNQTLRLLGQEATTDLEKEIFSRFCLGK